MAKRRNRLLRGQDLSAPFAMASFCLAGFCASCLNCGIRHRLVAKGGFLHVGGVVAARAGLVSFPADLGAGWGLCLVIHQVMTERINFARFRCVAARARSCLFALCSASRGGGLCPFAEVVAEGLDRLLFGQNLAAARALNASRQTGLRACGRFSRNLFFRMAQSGEFLIS